MLGSDLKSRVLDGPGIVRALPSSYRSLMDQAIIRSHPNKAVDVVKTKTQKCILMRLISVAASPLNPYLGHRPVHRVSLCSLLFHRRHSNMAQRLIYFAAYPQFVQQYRQLPRHRDNRSLLRVLPTTLAQTQPIPA
jgi:hypothetical protein